LLRRPFFYIESRLGPSEAGCGHTGARAGSAPGRSDRRHRDPQRSSAGGPSGGAPSASMRWIPKNEGSSRSPLMSLTMPRICPTALTVVSPLDRWPAAPASARTMSWVLATELLSSASAVSRRSTEVWRVRSFPSVDERNSSIAPVIAPGASSKSALRSGASGSDLGASTSDFGASTSYFGVSSGLEIRHHLLRTGEFLTGVVMAQTRVGERGMSPVFGTPPVVGPRNPAIHKNAAPSGARSRISKRG
jgi:hypothetical protein